MSFAEGDYKVTRFPDGTCKVELCGFERIGLFCKLHEVVANLNVDVADAKGFKVNKLVPKSEAEIQQQKDETRRRNIEQGKQRQRELNR